MTINLLGRTAQVATALLASTPGVVSIIGQPTVDSIGRFNFRPDFLIGIRITRLDPNRPVDATASFASLTAINFQGTLFPVGPTRMRPNDDVGQFVFEDFDLNGDFIGEETRTLLPGESFIVNGTPGDKITVVSPGESSFVNVGPRIRDDLAVTGANPSIVYNTNTARIDITGYTGTIFGLPGNWDVSTTGNASLSFLTDQGLQLIPEGTNFFDINQNLAFSTFDNSNVDGGSNNTISLQYVDSQPQPPESVPEPPAALGLLAIACGGLFLKRLKQNV